MQKSTNQEKEQFKLLAKEAVSRMKHGFWEDMMQKKNSEEIEKEMGEMTIQDKNQIRKTIISKSSQDASEMEFEQKVYALLEEDELSPIGKLMDKAKYQEMSIEERGRYVLVISNKFLKVKEKYEREKALKSKYSQVMQTLHI